MKEKTHEHKEHGKEEGCGHNCACDGDFDMEKDFNKLTMEEVVYGNQHVLNILLDLLIEKGIISEQELKDKLDQMVAESPDATSVMLDPEDENEDIKF
ncbi:MAG: hypothetical protein WC758_03410 [Candidatus Woesearchaeota archaeon]|jgi:hypothetical protein